MSTDTVLPVHFFDAAMQATQLSFLCRFDEVLDAEQLHAALTKLLQHPGGWRKLGARVRRSTEGKLEYHVPAEFSESRPAVDYHHEEFEHSISDHPAASRLPRPSDSSTLGVVSSDEDIMAVMRHHKDARTLDDYLKSDRPLLTLQIINFTDATLIKLNWSHLFFDGLARKALFDAWSLSLQGRHDEIPDLCGVETDPLAPLGTNLSKPYVYADKKLSSWQTVRLASRMVRDKVARRPKAETRVICVPPSELELIRKDAMASMNLGGDSSRDSSSSSVTKGAKTATTSPPSSPSLSPSFISDGDLLCAWWLRHITHSMGPSSKIPITLSLAYGLRRLLEKDLLPKDKVYMGNAISQVSSFFTVPEVMNKPLGHVAAKVRESITKTGTRDEINARAALDRVALDRTWMPAIFGQSSRVQTVICTNWCQGRFYDIDFSAAIVGKASQRQGKPSWVQPHIITPEGLFTNLLTTFVIIGKDAYGNHWLQAVLSKERWRRLESVLPGCVSPTSDKKRQNASRQPVAKIPVVTSVLPVSPASPTISVPVSQVSYLNSSSTIAA